MSKERKIKIDIENSSDSGKEDTSDCTCSCHNNSEPIGEAILSDDDWMKICSALYESGKVDGEKHITNEEFAKQLSNDYNNIKEGDVKNLMDKIITKIKEYKDIIEDEGKLKNMSKDAQELIKEYANAYPTTKKETIDVNKDDIRSFNIGTSDYSKHSIQPWDIWEDYNLNPWEADIVKRVLRTKEIPGMSQLEARIQDFEKIIHVSRKYIEILKKKNDILKKEI